MDKSEILKRAEAYIAAEQDARFSNEVKDLIAKEDYKELEDRFYQTLEFGTGGLRGIMGGGTNRMNTREINLATQGLANYVIKAFPERAEELFKKTEEDAIERRNNYKRLAMQE